MSTTNEKQKGSPLDRLLRVFSDVRAGESINVLLLLFDVFLLLVAYYVLKTLREPLILNSAPRDILLLQGRGLPEWLVNIFSANEDGGGEARLKAAAAACQAVALLGFIPLYSWFVSKVSRLWLLVGVSGFFISNLLLFYVALLAGVPLVGFVFYVWVGIFSVAMIAGFWSFANDVYTRSSGERLFPIIAVGATAGSPVGSWLGRELKGWEPGALVMLAATIITVYLVISLIVHFRVERSDAEDSVGGEAKPPETLKRGGGFALVLRNPFLLGIGVLMFLLNLVNTTGENILTQLVVQTAYSEIVLDDVELPDELDTSTMSEAEVAVAREEALSDARGAFIGGFYGNFFLWVNIIALLLQALVVSRLVKFLGIRAVVLALPLVAFGVYGLIALGVGLTAVRWAKSAENATDYSIMNTGKAMLWLPTTREEKYKGKQTVDTLFVRMGDLAAAALFIIGTSRGLGVSSMALINLGVIVVWIGVAVWVLKRHASLIAAEDAAADAV